MLQKLRLKLAFRRLKNFLKKVKNKEYTPKAVLEELFSQEASLIQPWQYKEEFLKLLELYHSKKPACAMEIGTANGGTLFAHCKLAQPNATLISVDLPGGKFGGGYPDWKVPIYSEFAKTNQKLHLIRASSYDQRTVDQVKGILNGKQLDYILIDGDHTYEGVKKDFDMYSPLVKKDGVIVFHDIVVHDGSSCKVDQFWNEIKKNYTHHEFITKPDQPMFGIGVLIK